MQHPIISHLFSEQAQGTYVDIGAAHPTILSVTHSLYESGWRGINVEPVRARLALFLNARPEDSNLNLAVGLRPGTVEYCDFVADTPEGIAQQAVRYQVEVATGDAVLAKLQMPLDLLSIHVNGHEADVLRSINFRQHRPKVLVIGAVKEVVNLQNRSDTPSVCPSWSFWEDYVLSHDYRLVSFDGHTRVYLRADLNLTKSLVSAPLSQNELATPNVRKLLFLQDERYRNALHHELTVVRQTYEALLAETQSMLEGKEQVINEQSRALTAYRLAFKISLPARPLFKRLVMLTQHGAHCFKRFPETFRPRLGNLRQYAPRALNVSFQSVSDKPLTAPPTISIVTPSFNQGHFIRETIESVLAQRYSALEYFVQDGGSQDGTVALLKAFEAELTGWDSRKDAGQTHAINTAFGRTQGEIMGWLNSDDLLLPGALHHVADYFSRHPEVDVIYGNRVLIDENGQDIGRWLLPGHDAEALKWADFIPQETLFWRRSLWEKVGGTLDESFKFAMDWDLLIRFVDVGAKFAHIPRFLGAFRVHGAQKTSQAINEIGIQEMNRIRERIWGHVPNGNEVRKKITPFMARHILVDLRFRVVSRLRGVR